jgi:hypothetical protein
MFAIVADGCGGAPPRPPPLPLPRPRPKPAPGIAKSGFTALASSITSSCLGGWRGPYPAYGPGMGGPGGGLQLGLMPRCDTEVKCDASDAAGDLAPSGISSKEGLRIAYWSLLLRDWLEELKFGLDELGCRPPGIKDAGIGPGGAR